MGVSTDQSQGREQVGMLSSKSAASGVPCLLGPGGDRVYRSHHVQSHVAGSAFSLGPAEVSCSLLRAPDVGGPKARSGNRSDST